MPACSPWVVAAVMALAAEGRAAEVSGAALARAARATTLAEIDPNDEQCRRDRSVETWLRELAGPHIRSIRWTGGGCRLKRPEVARDSGGRWCGQAHLRLARARGRGDAPMVEIYFEPVGNRPGKPYAFRGLVRVKDDEDYTRFTTEFEASWRARFPDAAARTCPAS